MAEGITIAEQNCFSCHSPTANPENKIAPSLAEIKQTYIRNNHNENRFVADMTQFLLTPSAALAKMKDAVSQYGIMPHIGLDKMQYESVSKYLFTAQLTQSNWYPYQFEKDKLKYAQKEADTINYLKVGKKIALQTKGVLGKNLLSAIQTKGTSEAVTFCNMNAIHITDSMSMALEASIKRVSDQPRNPNNKANPEELAYIKNTKQLLATNQAPQPKIIHNPQHVTGYYPIITNKMCLQCHGDVTQNIESKTLATIQKKYPNDAAVNYKANELRGIWVVQMKRK